MSVALYGPKGYEYQYVVTAFIALQHAKNENAKVFVEKIDGEDAELALDFDSVASIIEIQCKGTKDLGIRDLANWLLHFADRDADNFLLKRLKAQPTRLALVVTKARCLDEMRGFACNFLFRAHNKSPLTLKKQRDNFVKGLRDEKFGNTALERKRDEEAKKIADELNDDTKIDEITKRILVWETVTEGILEGRIHSELNRNYRIPQSQTHNLLLQILAAIRTARDAHADALPAIRSLLRTNAAEAVFSDSTFKSRQEIESLTTILSETRVLLLTGASLCGKTYTARYLSQQFQNQGFAILRTNTIKEANRFLSDPTNEDRLCLLEDPFGHVRLSVDADPVSLRRELSDIISELRSHRCLIVTTRSDILIAAYSASSIAESRINEHAWQDLTVKDKDFSLGLWREMITGRGIPEEVVNDIIASIQTATDATLLQPGQLRHLAREDLTRLRGKSLSQLMYIAKVDARDLGDSWCRRGPVFRRIAIALAITTNTIQKLRIPELSFVLSDSTDTPSLLIKERHGISMGFEGAPPPVYPSYTAAGAIPADYEEAFDLLESHGYVQRDSESLLFGHPNYQAAFEYVTDNLLESQFTDLISIASRGVAVLDPAIALNVLRSLGRLCEVFKNNVLRRQRLLQMIYSALQSIYPSVIDGALVFLLKYVNDLSEEKRDSVFRLVEQNIEIERVCWFKGMCWLNYQPTISASFADRLFPRYTIPMDRIKDAIIDLSDPSKVTSVTPEEAWNILQAIKRGDIDHDNVLLYQHLLAHEESFIRSKAAWLLASRFSPANPGIIGRLLGDEHPRVAYESLRGCFACWNTYEGQAKPSLREAAKLSLAKPGVAIAARRFLSDFGDSYGADHIERVDITREQEKALWDLWASIFPSFLRSLPEASIGINQPHLWDTARKACEFISSEQGLQIAEAWFEWIDQKLQKSLPKEFGLGVGDFLINATKGKPDLRFELLKKILAHLDSHFVFVAIADFIESWNDLTSSEKAFICNTLAGNRTDLRWLKAVALTREQVASEIETQILGTSINLSLDADTLLSTLAPELLSDCLHVYCGTPQPLWFLGKHHSEAEVWRRVMIKLCEKPEHPLFQMSLLEILVHKRHAHRDDGPQVWAALCKTKDEKLRDRLFELLLDSTIKGDDMVEYWAPFMKAISTDERAKFINKVIEKLPMLEYRDHRAPWTVIGEYTFFEILLPRLKGDKLILEAISLFRSIYESEDSKPGSAIKVKDDLISLLNLIYDNSPPKLLMTAAIVKSFLDDAESAEAKNLIEKCAKATSAKHLSWNQREYTPEPHGLPQWNSIFVEDATQS